MSEFRNYFYTKAEHFAWNLNISFVHVIALVLRNSLSKRYNFLLNKFFFTICFLFLYHNTYKWCVCKLYLLYYLFIWFTSTKLGNFNTLKLIMVIIGYMKLKEDFWWQIIFFLYPSFFIFKQFILLERNGWHRSLPLLYQRSKCIEIMHFIISFVKIFNHFNRSIIFN